MMTSQMEQALGTQAAVLRHVKIIGELRGMVLDVVQEQRFVNPTLHNIEAVYAFPLPAGSVLLDVSVHIGTQKLHAQIVPKTSAEASYESALADGDAAVMVEVNADGSYTLNLGNLAAQEEYTVLLHYARTLEFHRGGLRLQIPTVLAPRFGNPLLDARLLPHQVPSHNIDADYPLTLALRIPDGLAGGSVSSPSHTINMTPDGAGHVLSVAGAASMDRDFVLSIDGLVATSTATAVADPVMDGHYVAHASFLPVVPNIKRAPLAIKLLVDCSGSMAGDSIEAARSALVDVVDQFSPGDRFSLSRFGNTVEHAFARLRPASPAALRVARQWANNLAADMGGTEMSGALASTVRLGGDAAADVLLVTDGEIHAIDELIGTATASGQRVFVVGIGSTPAEGHLRRLAQATGGACDFVAPGEAAGPAILRMFARLSTPCWNRVQVKWPAQPVWEAADTVLFDGDTYHAYALFKHHPGGDVWLVAASLGTEQSVLASATIGFTSESSDTLARMAAITRLRSETGRAEQEQMALDYQLLTEHTNFILIHERAQEDKALDSPSVHVVPQMMAAGFGAFGTVLIKEPCSVQAARAAYHNGAIRAHIGSFSGMPAMFRRVDSFLSAHVEDGLTPLAFVKLASSPPAARIDRSYAGLIEAGLGHAIVYWLEAEFGDVEESLVVLAFLAVMARHPLSRMRLGQVAFGRVVNAALTTLRSRRERTRLALQTPVGILEQRIATALSELTPRSWKSVLRPAAPACMVDIPQFLRKQAD